MKIWKKKSCFFVVLFIAIWYLGGFIFGFGKVVMQVLNEPIKVRGMIDAAGGPHEVLQACRQLRCQMESNGVTRIVLDPSLVDSGNSPNPDFNLPLVLRQMPITIIAIDENRLFIRLTESGRMCFLAFKEDVSEYGGNKIIDGLWYTSDSARDKKRFEKKAVKKAAEDLLNEPSKK